MHPLHRVTRRPINIILLGAQVDQANYITNSQRPITLCNVSFLALSYYNLTFWCLVILFVQLD